MERPAAGTLATLSGRLALVGIAIFLGVTLFVTLTQRRLLYFPDTQRVAPEQTGLAGVTEVTIATADGERLVAWWSPPKPGKPIVLYFHGNGGNIAIRAGRLALFQEAGFGALLVSYRGYGGSTGSPSETALVADARLAFDWLAAKAPTHPIVVFGESLGTGVAVQLAITRPVAGVVLDSPFTSLPDVAARSFPYLPVHWLMWDRLDSLSVIAKLRAPLFIVHGERDGLIPISQSQALFAAAPEPKTYLRLPGAGHVVPMRDGAWPAVRTFIDRLAAR